jgi:hypothetical protein
MIGAHRRFCKKSKTPFNLLPFLVKVLTQRLAALAAGQRKVRSERHKTEAPSGA